MKLVSVIMILEDSELLGHDAVLRGNCVLHLGQAVQEELPSWAGRKILHFPGSVHPFLQQHYFYLISFPCILIIY